MIKSFLMKEFDSSGGREPLQKRINLSDVLSSLIVESVSKEELDKRVVSELNNLIQERHIKVKSVDLADFEREPSLHQRWLNNLHSYGLNGCLSEFSIRRIDKEAERDFPFLDQFDGCNFSSYVLSARYRSAIKGIDDIIRGMFVINLGDKNDRFISWLRLSNYLQLPESIAGSLSSKGKERWKTCKDNYENRKTV